MDNSHYSWDNNIREITQLTSIPSKHSPSKLYRATTPIGMHFFRIYSRKAFSHEHFPFSDRHNADLIQRRVVCLVHYILAETTNRFGPHRSIIGVIQRNGRQLPSDAVIPVTFLIQRRRSRLEIESPTFSTSRPASWTSRSRERPVTCFKCLGVRGKKRRMEFLNEKCRNYRFKLNALRNTPEAIGLSDRALSSGQ